MHRYELCCCAYPDPLLFSENTELLPWHQHNNDVTALFSCSYSTVPRSVIFPRRFNEEVFVYFTGYMDKSGIVGKLSTSRVHCRVSSP